MEGDLILGVHLPEVQMNGVNLSSQDLGRSMNLYTADPSKSGPGDCGNGQGGVPDHR